MHVRRLLARSAVLATLLAPPHTPAQSQPAADPAPTQAPIPSATQVPIPAPNPSANTAPNRAQPPPTPEDLLHTAVEAVGANHLAQAHTLLDRVLLMDPNLPGLWSAFGVLSLRENDASTAVLDLRRELATHPDALQIYAPLASTLVSLKRRPEALETLRAWSAAVPADPHPVGLLVGMLLDEGEIAAALKAGTEGLARLPDASRNDPQLQYAVGLAELKGGDETDGSKRLTVLLQGTADPSARNSIAFALADAGRELPTAEATERSVLSQLELESEGWSLDGNPQTPLFGTQLLSAAWDTLGWILFREGNFTSAEPLVRASWRNNPHADIGNHLSRIEAARGAKAAAATDLALALTAAKATPPANPVEAASLAAMEARLVTLGSLRGPTGSPARSGQAVGGTQDADTALQRLRTFPLGPSGGRTGTSTYRVLIARGKVIHARHDSGDLSGPAIDSLLPHADLSPLFPAAGSYVQLVHRVILRCTPRACEMALLP